VVVEGRCSRVACFLRGDVVACPFCNADVDADAREDSNTGWCVPSDVGAWPFKPGCGLAAGCKGF
jgi:hypothetical protein